MLLLMQVVNVKVIREKGSGAAAGYGFVEFVTHEIAEQVLQSYVGQPIPGTCTCFSIVAPRARLAAPNMQCLLSQDRILTIHGAMSGAPNKRYRLNWAQFGIGEKKPMAPLQAHHSIFVGDLAPEVTDQLLEVRLRADVHCVGGSAGQHV